MTSGALTLVDHMPPAVPLRQWVVTMPFPTRSPLALDEKLLGQVLVQRRFVPPGTGVVHPSGAAGAGTCAHAPKAMSPTYVAFAISHSSARRWSSVSTSISASVATP
jgi:hypothetical protein